MTGNDGILDLVIIHFRRKDLALHEIVLLRCNLLTNVGTTTTAKIPARAAYPQPQPGSPVSVAHLRHVRKRQHATQVCSRLPDYGLLNP